MIEFSHVTFSYSRHKSPVLEDIDFSLEPGHIYGLLGKNGVGKSTLFRLISGANPPDSGKVLTFGMIPFKRKPSMLADIFLFPEDILFPAMNIQEYGNYYGSFYPHFSREDMLALAERFGINIAQKMNTMSQGQRKKAYMSFALACNTRLLLMDEPTNGLDIPSKAEFRLVLSEYQKPDRLILISTHQVRDLELLIDAVMILDDKKLVLSETASKLLSTFHFGDVSENDHIIYEEKTVRSTVGLAKRMESQKVQDLSAFDLETLFNAVMTKRDELYNCLGKSHE